jgi:hypothetical protein
MIEATREHTKKMPHMLDDYHRNLKSEYKELIQNRLQILAEENVNGKLGR